MTFQEIADKIALMTLAERQQRVYFQSPHDERDVFPIGIDFASEDIVEWDWDEGTSMDGDVLVAKTNPFFGEI